MYLFCIERAESSSERQRVSIQTFAVHLSVSSLPAISPQTGPVGFLSLVSLILNACCFAHQSFKLLSLKLHLVSLLRQVFRELRGRAAPRCKFDIQ